LNPILSHHQPNTPTNQKKGKDVTDTGSVKEAYRGVMGAPSAPAFTAPPLVPAFTRRREIQVGRWAMIGIAAAAAWEVRSCKSF
jgi:hypothetical protein